MDLSSRWMGSSVGRLQRREVCQAWRSQDLKTLLRNLPIPPGGTRADFLDFPHIDKCFDSFLLRLVVPEGPAGFQFVIGFEPIGGFVEFKGELAAEDVDAGFSGALAPLPAAFQTSAAMAFTSARVTGASTAPTCTMRPPFTTCSQRSA